MFKDFKDFCTAREPGEGVFGGADGAIRFLALSVIVIIVATIAIILS